MEETKPILTNKVAYRPVIVTTLAELIGKYRPLSDYEAAVKLLVDEELLILKKDGNVAPTQL
jgi:hypothetical protein